MAPTPWILNLSLLLLTAALAGCSDDGGDGSPVEEGPGIPVSDVAPATFEATGAIQLGNDALGNTPTGCGNVGQEGFDQVTHTWEVPGDVNGTAVRPATLTVTLTLVDPTLLDADLYVHGPDGAELGRSTNFNAQTGPSESVALGGGLASGTYTIVVRGCSGSGGYSLSGVAELFPVLPAAA